MTSNRSPKTTSKKSVEISPEQIFQKFKNIGSEEKFSDCSSFARVIESSQSLILVSDSTLRLRRFCELFIEKVSSVIPDLEIEKYSSSDLSNEKSLSGFMFNCNSDSLFARAKIIMVKDADSLKVAQIGRILELFPLTDKNIILFQCRKIPAGDNWKKLSGLSSVCTFSEFSKADLSKWITQEFRKRGASGISQEGLQYLTNEVNVPLEVLDHIIEKACLLAYPDSEINMQILRQVSETSIEKDTFDLFEIISKRDTLAAQIVLRSILQNGTHPLQILGFFNKAIKSLIVQKSKTSTSDPVYFADLNNTWFLKKLHPERFSLERLSNALKVLAELDSDMKGRNFGEDQSLFSKLVSI
jgi:DNA polymerase III delta subunit